MGSRYNWTNSDGLVVSGGRRTSENDHAGLQKDVYKTVVAVVPQGAAAQGAGAVAQSAVIPAGSIITDVVLQGNGALTSLVNLVVGVTDADGGSNITDADGLVLAIDAAEVLALRPKGSVVGTAFDGAVLTTSVPLTEDAIVTWAAGTASSAGDVSIVVTYIEPGL